MKIKLLFLIIFVQVNAFGLGGEVGNGGDVIVCGNEVTLLDIYEAKSLRHLELKFGADALTVMEKVDLGLRRLALVDPWRAYMMASIARDFFERSLFAANINLRDIDDSQQVFLPTGCTLEQIAIQKMKALWTDPDFVISKDLWEKLDNDNKAALILHEALFFVSDGALGSPLVRALNSFMFTDVIISGMDVHGQRPNIYYRLVENSPLNERLEIFPAAKPQEQDGDPRWFFQLPNPKKLQTSKGWVADKAQAQFAWQGECELYEAEPINMEDFKKISAHLNFISRGAYEWKAPTYVQLDVLRIVLVSSEGINVTDEAADGSLWCVGKSNPFTF